MIDYVGAIELAVRATVVRDLERVSSFGIPLRLPGGMDRQLAVTALAEHLYHTFYLGGDPAAGVRGRRAPGMATRPSEFVDGLRRANSGSGPVQSGWTMVGDDGGWRVIERDGFRLRVEERSIEPESVDPASLATGASVRLHLPPEQLGKSPGFYLVLGDDPYPNHGDGPVVRFYWSLASAGASDLVRELSEGLNDRRVPFQCKVLNDPRDYWRPDAGVVYLNADDLAIASPVLESAWQRLRRAGFVRPTTGPALTKPVVDGVAFAEDPGTGESFGQQRCGLLAEGIFRAWEAGERTMTNRMLIVGETFAETGVSFETPYLNPGSANRYHIDWHATRVSPARLGSPSPRRGLIDLARMLGDHLVEHAIWHEDRCTWLGAGGDPDGVPLATLGPALYDGTAGVALALVELHAVIADEAYRNTALGAYRQALALADRIPGPVRSGWHTGLPGISWAVQRAAALGVDGGLAEASRGLLDRLPGDDGRTCEQDLLSGVAGAILVLVTNRDGSDDALLEQAVSLGDRLLADAEIDARGWRWRSPAAPRALPLTGFSHGASGIGHALLALFAATGEARFREAALGAFAWERSWFDGDAGNWPDFRDVAPSALRLGTALPNAVAWCHGAPGILLSRLYAAKLLDDERLRVEARTVAMTTQRSLTAMAADPLASLGLCHGLAGNALILMRAATELADDTLGKHAQDALATLWERDLLSQLALEPTLMTGLSGLILACLSGDGLPISDVLSGVPPTE